MKWFIRLLILILFQIQCFQCFQLSLCIFILWFNYSLLFYLDLNYIWIQPKCNVYIHFLRYFDLWQRLSSHFILPFKKSSTTPQCVLHFHWITIFLFDSNKIEMNSNVFFMFFSYSFLLAFNSAESSHWHELINTQVKDFSEFTITW